MKLINLTMPLYDGMPAGYGHVSFKTHPLWPDAFKIEETRSYDSDGMSTHVFTIPASTNTRLIMAGFRKAFKDEATLDTVDLSRLISRAAVVIDVPQGDDGLIESESVAAAVSQAPVQRGDALLMRTGWGDNQRYFKMGHDFRKKSPHYTGPAADKLMDLLEENGSDLWLYDTCDMGGIDKKTGKFAGFTIRTGMMSVGGVVNCGAITRPRVKLVILPLMVKGAHMGPCSVAAIEE